MASNARIALDDNKSDLNQLWGLHEDRAGTTQGRKYGVEVLNRAVIVFVCAIWESYCEDVIKESVNHIVADLTDATRLPQNIKDELGKALKSDKMPRDSPWKLVNGGWKTEYKDYVNDRVDALNTPKHYNVKLLMKDCLGIEDITVNWRWQRCTVRTATDKLNGFVSLRGDIAHRLVSPNTTVQKTHGQHFLRHIEQLADKTEVTISDHLNQLLGKRYW